MGAGSSASASSADFNNLKAVVTNLQKQLSDYDTVKAKINDVSSNLAKDINYDNVAKSITGVSEYNQNIANAISKNPNALGELLTNALSKNETAIASITTGLQTNTEFANTLSSKLTDDASGFRIKLKGDKGNDGSIVGDVPSVKKALYDKKEGASAGYTMWCADGDICKLPVDSTGIDFMRGGSKIQEKDGQFNIESDDNIYFNTGNKLRAIFNNDGATVKGNLNVEGTINISGWKIEGGADNSLVFRRGDATDADDQPYLRMGKDGNFWVSRSTYRGWIPDNMKVIRNPDELIVADWRIKKEGDNIRVFHKDQSWNYYEFNKGIGTNDKWVDWTKK